MASIPSLHPSIAQPIGTRAAGALCMLAVAALLGGCAAAAVTTGAVAVAGAGVKTVATVAEAGVRAAVPDRSDYSNKWRLECSGNAESDGEVVFHITPKDAERQVVTIPVKRGTGENAVARTLRDGLKAQLDKGRFAVEVDDGEDILVKRKGRAPDFALQVAENTVKGLRLNPDKE
jgi:hypothetical protein